MLEPEFVRCVSRNSCETSCEAPPRASETVRAKSCEALPSASEQARATSCSAPLRHRGPADLGLQRQRQQLLPCGGCGSKWRRLAFQTHRLGTSAPPRAHLSRAAGAPLVLSANADAPRTAAAWPDRSSKAAAATADQAPRRRALADRARAPPQAHVQLSEAQFAAFAALKCRRSAAARPPGQSAAGPQLSVPVATGRSLASAPRSAIARRRRRPPAHSAAHRSSP